VIRYVFLDDPGADQVLLFACDGAGAKAFAALLSDLARAELGATIVLDQHRGFDPRDNRCVVIELDGMPSQIAVGAAPGSPLVWHTNQQSCVVAAEMVSVLTHGRPGHQYLEDVKPDIVVSANEWTGPVWKDALRARLGFSV